MPELKDQFEAIGVGDIVPADPVITILEPPFSRAPAEHGKESRSVITLIRLAVNHLPMNVPHGAAIFETMVLAKA